MTGQYYVPPPSGPQVTNQGLTEDVLFRGARSVIRTTLQRRNSFRLIEPPRELRGFVQPWELIIYDFAGGVGSYQAPFFDSPNTYIWADGMDLTHPGYIMLAQANGSTTIDATGSLVGVHTEFIFNRQMWGLGSGANVSLIAETSATDPTPAAVTYSPGAVITCLGQVVIGGATLDRRLIVGRDGAAAQIIGDAAGTVDATMNAATADMWWIVQTSLPASGGGFLILMHVGNNISYLTTVSATGDAPTAASTNVALEGSYLIKPGEFAMADGPFGGVNRVWIVLSKENTTAGLLQFGSEVKGFVTSMNLEGTDLQKLEFNELVNGVLGASYVVSPLHGPSIIAHDGERAVLHNGAVEENLHLLSEANIALMLNETTLNSALDYFRIRGFVIDGPNIYAWVVAVDIAGAQAGIGYLFLYDWVGKAWHIVSDNFTLSAASTPRIVLPASNHALSPNTRFTQFYEGGDSWFRMQLPRPGEVPYPKSLPVPGVTSTFSANAGTVRSSHWILPGLENRPSLIESVEVMGDIDNSGSDGSMQVEVARATGFGTAFDFGGLMNTSPNTATFNDSTQYDSTNAYRRRNYRRWAENNDYFFDFHTRVTLTRGSTTDRSPMISGIIYRGLTFLDGNIRTPKEVWGS